MTLPLENTEPRRFLFLLILALCGFVTSFGAHIVATNLPFLAQKIGIGALMIGLLIAVYDFAELFAKPVAGLLADRLGMKLLLLAGIAVFIVGSLLFLWLDPRYLLLVRFVQGLGAAALSTVSITLVAHYFPGQGKGTAFGIYNAIKGAGYVLAPLAGGYLVHRSGFSAIFVTSALVGGLAFASSLILPGGRRAKEALDDDDDDLLLREFFAVFRESTLLPVYAVILINMFMAGILFGFLPVYLKSLGGTAVQSGLLVSLATASYLLSQPVAGYAADRLPIRRIVVGGLALAGAAITVVTFTTGVWLAVVIVLAGIGVGAVWTNSDTLVSTLVDRRSLGAGMGAAQSFKELGDMLGPLIIGAITQFFGVRIGFVACGLTALALLLLLVRSPTFRLRQEDGSRQDGPHA